MDSKCFLLTGTDVVVRIDYEFNEACLDKELKSHYRLGSVYQSAIDKTLTREAFEAAQGDFRGIYVTAKAKEISFYGLEKLNLTQENIVQISNEIALLPQKHYETDEIWNHLVDLND